MRLALALWLALAVLLMHLVPLHAHAEESPPREKPALHAGLGVGLLVFAPVVPWTLAGALIATTANSPSALTADLPVTLTLAGVGLAAVAGGVWELVEAARLRHLVRPVMVRALPLAAPTSGGAWAGVALVF